ncbi:hypothetical protein NFC81_00545 [Salinispirillum sp. LH 10-3-1]|uniref:DUF4115 domain-containing protein n=1 Tax=Salinispirillum sp. LH 10-3-1 TaxID=2952525 RepID=A0AB38YFZ1_9GAMM
MSAVLRYRHPKVCQHLASQYVAGHLSPGVRRRMEMLLPQHPPLADAVAEWSDELWQVQASLPTQEPPKRVWRDIKRTLLAGAPQKHRTFIDRVRNGWQDVTALRWWAAGSSIAALVLVSVLLWQPDTPPVRTASYMAPLSQGDTITLVVYGYQGETPGTSALRLQWAETEVPRPEGALHLWAELKGSAELVYLGELVAGQSWRALSRTEWQALAGSSRLLINDQAVQLDMANVLMEGPCVQLRAYPSGQPS